MLELRRVVSFVVVALVLLAEWGIALTRPSEWAGASEVAVLNGWQAVFAQTLARPALLPVLAEIGWLLGAVIWFWLRIVGSTVKGQGWDVALVGFWALCLAAWVQALWPNFTLGVLADGRWVFITIGFGFWLFIAGLVVGVVVRFFDVVIELITGQVG